MERLGKNLFLTQIDCRLASTITATVIHLQFTKLWISPKCKLLRPFFENKNSTEQKTLSHSA